MLQAILQDFSESFTAIEFSVTVARLLAAMVLGAIIGLERELRRKPAGLRTNMLVSLAACLFVIVGIELTQLDFGQDARTDPLRLIQAVTAGVAFLAAGLIFTTRGQVRNITTGVTLWLAGAIGLACGAGQIALATLVTVLVVLVLVLIRAIERALGTYAYHDDSSSEGPDGS